MKAIGVVSVRFYFLVLILIKKGYIYIYIFVMIAIIRWEKAKKAREDRVQEEKEKTKAEAKPTLGDSMWADAAEKEEEVRDVCSSASLDLAPCVVVRLSCVLLRLVLVRVCRCCGGVRCVPASISSVLIQS